MNPLAAVTWDRRGRRGLRSLGTLPVRRRGERQSREVTLIVVGDRVVCDRHLGYRGTVAAPGSNPTRIPSPKAFSIVKPLIWLPDERICTPG